MDTQKSGDIEKLVKKFSLSLSQLCTNKYTFIVEDSPRLL